MVNDAAQSRLFQLFAQMLHYPQPGLASAVGECAVLVSPSNQEAGALLGEFQVFVEKTPYGKLEEVFSGAFDLDAACYPYVGYHLFGESYKRSVFMLGLKERYRASGFEIPGNELPDHLAVILGFLALCNDPAESEELVQEALLPTLARMTRKPEDDPSEQSADLSGPAAAHGADLETAKPDTGESPGTGGRRIIYYKVLQALHLVLTPMGNGGTPAALESATVPAYGECGGCHSDCTPAVAEHQC